MVGKDPFTIHTIVPGFAGAVVGGLTFSAIKYYYKKNQINTEFYWYPKFNFVVCGITAFIGYYLTKMRLLKSFRIVSFAPAGGALGLKQVPGRRDNVNPRPPMSIFYSCERNNSSMNSKDVNTRTSWLPNNGDLRYTEGMAMFVAEVMGHTPGSTAKNLMYHLLCFLFRHWSHSEMEVVTNARPSIHQLVKHAPQSTETTPTRIVIFCHGMGGNQHIHSDFVMRHINALPGGAGIVICPNFVEGSSGFCLRDDRDVVGVPLKESSHKMSFKEEPHEKFVQMREEQLASRVKQVEEVMKFICSREEFSSHAAAQQQQSNPLGAASAASVGGGLASVLFPGNPELQTEFLNKITSIKSDKIEVRLVGHSFGGATVVKAVLDRLDEKVSRDITNQNNNSEEYSSYGGGSNGSGSGIHIQSVTALDTWMTPLSRSLSDVSSKDSKDENKNDDNDEPLPPLLLIDSHQWEKWSYNKKLEEKLLEIYPGKSCSRIFDEGTDHMTAMDMAAVVPKFFRYPKAKPSEDDSFRRKWATKSVQP